MGGCFHRIFSGDFSLEINLGNKSDFKHLRLKSYLERCEKSTSNSHHIYQKEDANNILFFKTAVLKGLTDSQIALCRYCHQIPNYDERNVMKISVTVILMNATYNRKNELKLQISVSLCYNLD